MLDKCVKFLQFNGCLSRGGERSGYLPTLTSVRLLILSAIIDKLLKYGQDEKTVRFI